MLEKERKFEEIVSLSKKSKAPVSRTLKQVMEKDLILTIQNLNWKAVLEECLKQQAREKKLISLTLLDMLDEMKKRYKIHTPIERKLHTFVLKKLILHTLKKSKTVKELVYELQRPEPTLRKVLKELLKEGKIKKIKKGKPGEFVRM